MDLASRTQMKKEKEGEEEKKGKFFLAKSDGNGDELQVMYIIHLEVCTPTYYAYIFFLRVFVIQRIFNMWG